MKIRGVILAMLVMIVFFASYACAIEPEPQTASSAAPVMVPYLGKSISEVKQNGYTNAAHGHPEATGQAGAEGRQDSDESGNYLAAVGTFNMENIDMRSDYTESLSELVESGTASGDTNGTASGEAEEMVERGGDSPDPVLTYYGCCRITFYDANSCCCGEFANGYTASGEPAIVGWTVANGELPFGTMVMIDGRTYCVTDRGVGADEFDILVDTHEEALVRGLYYADVYIIN